MSYGYGTDSVRTVAAGDWRQGRRRPLRQLSGPPRLPLPLFVTFRSPEGMAQHLERLREKETFSQLFDRLDSQKRAAQVRVASGCLREWRRNARAVQREILWRKLLAQVHAALSADSATNRCEQALTATTCPPNPVWSLCNGGEAASCAGDGGRGCPSRASRRDARRSGRSTSGGRLLRRLFSILRPIRS